VTAVARQALAWAALLGMALLTATASAATAPPEPQGYRTSHYRAPVPATVDGKPALTTDQAASLWRDHAAIFIDTLPQAPRPANLPAGTIWHRKVREDIPNSIWLPDTGYGQLPAIMETYFETNLREATANDRNRHLVFYCLANCWMSWNAAKHAMALGYTRVDWYAGGTDEWAAHHLPLEPREPKPRP
jgi:PQQ-dependent catabolism-associated CXXCW motif protein